MKVSNAQAMSDKTCGLYCSDCDLALSKPENWHCPHGETHVSKYAADLLEARDLLKKAIDLLEYCSEDPVNDFLEKTKEYAE